MKKGFTLAEVLITLVIIGVIAAMTIPSLLNSTDQQQWKTGCKKAFSTLETVISVNEVSGDYDVVNSTSTDNLYSLLQSRLDVVSTAKPDGYSIDASNAGNFGSIGCDADRPLVTKDGFIYTLAPGNGGILVDLANNQHAERQAYICADVNGARKPNRLTGGANALSNINNTVSDIFVFAVTAVDGKSKLLPAAGTIAEVIYGTNAPMAKLFQGGPVQGN